MKKILSLLTLFLLIAKVDPCMASTTTEEECDSQENFVPAILQLEEDVDEKTYAELVQLNNLMTAETGDQQAIVEQISPELLNVNWPGDITHLHRAASFNYAKVIIWLIGKGANINAKDMRGNTPLHAAVEGKAKEAMFALLKEGADRTAKNQNGFTPLGLAEKLGPEELAEILAS